jgi:catechol 2,3-dioxygenase-like lactoylglutathione lyase family enzyme
MPLYLQERVETPKSSAMIQLGVQCHVRETGSPRDRYFSSDEFALCLTPHHTVHLFLVCARCLRPSLSRTGHIMAHCKLLSNMATAPAVRGSPLSRVFMSVSNCSPSVARRMQAGSRHNRLRCHAAEVAVDTATASSKTAAPTPNRAPSERFDPWLPLAAHGSNQDGDRVHPEAMTCPLPTQIAATPGAPPTPLRTPAPAPRPRAAGSRVIVHGVHHVALICADLEASMAFYHGVLGARALWPRRLRQRPGATPPHGRAAHCPWLKRLLSEFRARTQQGRAWKGVGAAGDTWLGAPPGSIPVWRPPQGAQAGGRRQRPGATPCTLAASDASSTLLREQLPPARKLRSALSPTLTQRAPAARSTHAITTPPPTLPPFAPTPQAWRSTPTGPTASCPTAARGCGSAPR